VLSGVAKLYEYANDGLTWAGGMAVSSVSRLFGQKEFAENFEEMVMDEIARDKVGEMNEFFYENTELGKSINDAPAIFQDGLKELLQKINAGDSTITPYMDFAKDYPVRDSMRMMRLLYRLGLGSQERKQEQLIQFSRSISNLQQKARETRYKNRLEKMESKTMIMLVVTGIGVMILLVISIMNM
jgi:hypothetical protein